MTDRAPSVRLKRIAKGKRPQYFCDPAIDKLHVMVLELTQELSVTRDRLDALERVLDAAGVVSFAIVDSWRPDAVAAGARAARRAAMLSRVFRASEQELEEVMGANAAADAPQTLALS